MAACATKEELVARANAIAKGLIGQGRIGLDSQISYFYENKAVEKFMAMAPYYKDAYKGLRNLDLGIQERNGLWSDKLTDDFDIANYLKTLNDGQERIERTKRFNERRNQEAASFGLQSASIFNGADIAEGPNAKPALRYAFVDELPDVPEYIVAEQYPVFDTPDGAHQLFGINAMLDAYTQKKPAFFLADRQGVGKTLQLLTVANEIAIRAGRKVLIVAENEQIIETRFKADARLLNKTALNKISNERIEFVTFRNLGKKSAENYAAILWDESQNIANFNNAHKTAMQMKTDFEVFSTGTPFETPLQSVLFMAKLDKTDEDTAADKLGFAIVRKTKKDRFGNEKEYTYMDTYEKDEFKFYMEYSKLIDSKIRSLVRSGQFLKRQYPFWGDVIATDMTAAMPAHWMMKISNIDAYFKKRIQNYKWIVEAQGGKTDDYRHKEQIERYGQARLMNIMKATETAKADFIWAETQSYLNEGNKVIIATNFVGDATANGQYMLEIEGINGEEATKKKGPDGKNMRDVLLEPTLLEKIKKKLTEQGISFSELHGEVEAMKGRSSASARAAMLDRFQKGDAQVMLMTMKSGSTGIDLDDQVGDKPRAMIVATKGFSEKTLQQLVYRISRRNTKSKGTVIFAEAKTKSDERSNAILYNKKSILSAIMDESADVESSDVNIAVKIKEQFAENKDMLARKGLSSEQDLYVDYKKFQRENSEGTFEEYMNEVKKC